MDKKACAVVQSRFKQNLETSTIKNLAVKIDTIKPVMCQKCGERISRDARYWLLDCAHAFHSNCHG